MAILSDGNGSDKPPDNIIPANDKAANLQVLSKRINAQVAILERSLCKAVTFAADLGDSYLQVKDQLPHGEWGAWLDEFSPLTRRTAEKYMQLARARADGNENWARLARLPLNDAVKLLALPRPDAEPTSNAPGGALLPPDDSSPDPPAAVRQHDTELPAEEAPDRWKPVLEGRDKMAALIRDIKIIRRKVKRIMAEPGVSYLHFQPVSIALKDAERAIKFAMPAGPCGLCEAGTLADCKGCTPPGGGKPLCWVSRERYEMQPKDLRLEWD